MHFTIEKSEQLNLLSVAIESFSYKNGDNCNRAEFFVVFFFHFSVAVFCCLLVIFLPLRLSLSRTRSLFPIFPIGAQQKKKTIWMWFKRHRRASLHNPYKRSNKMNTHYKQTNKI